MDKITSEKPARVGDGTPGPGRPKGSQNRTTKAAKDAITEAASRIGGVDRLVEWIQEEPANEKAFWGTIYPKLLPLQVNGAGDEGEHLHELTVRFVRPG